MKKLYIDIRFAKCILALTAGWLMAGCSAEDELENGSATQQLSMTTMVNDKKFLMSSQGKYTITQDPEQDIPVELVRAAAKIKLNISSTVKDYKITKVMWKFINYNTNTAIFANQPADQNIKKNIQENKATAEKDENGNDIYKINSSLIIQ